VNEYIALVIVDPTRAASTDAKAFVPIMRRTVTRYWNIHLNLLDMCILTANYSPQTPQLEEEFWLQIAACKSTSEGGLHPIQPCKIPSQIFWHFLMYNSPTERNENVEMLWNSAGTEHKSGWASHWNRPLRQDRKNMPYTDTSHSSTKNTTTITLHAPLFMFPPLLTTDVYTPLKTR